MAIAWECAAERPAQSRIHRNRWKKFMTLPILYSFRRCPYAIRTRLALVYAEQKVVLREVVLRNKPDTMLAISPKGTVPVLQLSDGRVLDESRDIIMWALQKNDPHHLLAVEEGLNAMQSLIDENDDHFKHWLDRYKYSERYPEQNREYYRQQAEVFLEKLDQCLNKNVYLFGQQPSLADISIMPFVRQFAHVDKQWFDDTGYSALKTWLQGWLEAPIFLKVMQKYLPWQEESEILIF